MLQSSRVGPYELIRPLGAGGMAETFVAVKRGPAGFEQRVCLKRILHGHTAEPAFVELFLDEARLLAQLSNACIVQVYDFGEADGTYYMALELVDGADLHAVLRGAGKSGERLPVSVALYISAQLLGALEYAHSLSVDGQPMHIVHRDISPSNILLSRHGEVKLTDFGIAKSRNRTHKTQTGHTKGKVAYMSPEQVRGEPIDSRSDLFSMGVVVYELLTGSHPFDADTDLTLLNNILAGTRRGVQDRVPELSDEVALFVDRLLSVDPAARPASAGEALRLIPFMDQPFIVQRQLAEVVNAYRAANPSRSESSKSTPVGVLSQAASDGATAVLPPRKTPADRLAMGARPTTNDVVLPRSRPGLTFALIGGAVLLLALALGAAFRTAGPERAATQPPALPAIAPAPKAPGSSVPSREGTPGALPPSAVEPVAVPALPPAVDAGSTSRPPAESAPEPHSDTNGRKSGSGRHRRAADHSSAGPGSATSKTPAEKARGRSGVSVSPDEF